VRSEDRYLWDHGLSDRELHFIGSILAHWGAIEHEVFNQTLLTFDQGDDGPQELPRAMNNLQFSAVLALWRERVIATYPLKLSENLERQYQRIIALKPYRDALVHGMWQWTPADVEQITTVRIKHKAIISTRFTADDLEEFANTLAAINFHLRYPGGVEDLARERAATGFSISRRGLAALSDSKIAGDWLKGSGLKTGVGQPDNGSESA
jgi:hypothetical protein